ncbi:hypothetical protein FTX61_13200 [Nitriliruptoraceae bacterium ZYF776]|nr:hypothetical protein [Profundirhabdus halotolerans]
MSPPPPARADLVQLGRFADGHATPVRAEPLVSSPGRPTTSTRPNGAVRAGRPEVCCGGDARSSSHRPHDGGVAT